MHKDTFNMLPNIQIILFRCRLTCVLAKDWLTPGHRQSTVGDQRAFMDETAGASAANHGICGRVGFRTLQNRRNCPNCREKREDGRLSLGWKNLRWGKGEKKDQESLCFLECYLVRGLENFSKRFARVTKKLQFISALSLIAGR